MGLNERIKTAPSKEAAEELLKELYRSSHLYPEAYHKKCQRSFERVWGKQHG